MQQIIHFAGAGPNPNAATKRFCRGRTQPKCCKWWILLGQDPARMLQIVHFARAGPGILLPRGVRKGIHLPQACINFHADLGKSRCPYLTTLPAETRFPTRIYDSHADLFPHLFLAWKSLAKTGLPEACRRPPEACRRPDLASGRPDVALPGHRGA